MNNRRAKLAAGTTVLALGALGGVALGTNHGIPTAQQVTGSGGSGAIVLVGIAQPQRHRLADQLAENAAPARQAADLTFGLVVDAAIDEALELGAVGVEDPQRCVLGGGDLARRLDHRAQDGLEVESAPVFVRR